MRGADKKESASSFLTPFVALDGRKYQVIRSNRFHLALSYVRPFDVFLKDGKMRTTSGDQILAFKRIGPELNRK